MEDKNEGYQFYELLLDKLGLREYYPGKITFREAISIRKTSKEELTDLPWRIIHKLFLCDSQARDNILSEISPANQGSQPNQVSGSGDDCFGLDDFIDTTSYANSDELSTLDVLVVIFSCCDSFLKQALAQKLFICKLAIPFLYPLRASAKPMLSLWALRGIEVNDKSVTDTPTPVVAFLRLGNLHKFSKSKLINDILNDNNHHTFVNYDSKNGTVKKVLSNGLVECSWKIQDKLSCMFLNLRGDVSTLENQCQLLCDLSSTVVLLVTTKSLAAHAETYKKISKASKKVIVLILADPSSSLKDFKKDLTLCKDAVGKEILDEAKLIFSKLPDGRDMSNSQMKSSIWNALSQHLTGHTGPVLQDYWKKRDHPVIVLRRSSIVPASVRCQQHRTGFGPTLGRRGTLIGNVFADIDENIPACQEGKKIAQEITGPLFDLPAINRKGRLLPLQEKAWQEFCTLKKALHRTTATEGLALQQQKEKIKKEMQVLRDSQCENRLTIPKRISNILQKENESVCIFFLSWIKLMLDADSKTNLTDLRLQYSKEWESLQTKRKVQADISVIQNLYSKVENLEKDMAKVSIGLEHLFREVGQMFEAFPANSMWANKGMLQNLPAIAAKLLMSGHPLELLDGDASGIPLQWIEAVFKELNLLTDGKPMYVMSVMGVQSSGKSTLLNTMFGLQFAVSAGRCTRGAFMQLIEIHRSLGFPFSYVLIIDTEGLRATELASAKRVFDNELATLAVGLADITVINIKGENTSEVQDILQIVVYAFLRMNSANTNKYYQPKCAFVHQNVPDVNAQEKMVRGRQKLLQILDEMTKEAALGEGRGDVTSFSDVIHFDVINHNWYFPDLWLGNPPMAPVNPKYSEQVEKVKHCLLHEIAGQQTFLNASDLLLRIKDIWNGILCEDFIFSFRNTIEIKAYGMLETEYNRLLWQLQDMVKSFMEGEANTNMTKCQTRNKLDEMFNKMTDVISNKIEEKTKTITGKLEEYVKTNKYKEIIIQWKSSKSIGLRNEATKQVEESKTLLTNLKEKCRLKILQSDESSPYLQEFERQANALALRKRGSNMTEMAMKEVFDKEWKQFIKEFHSKEEHIDIKGAMSKALSHHFASHNETLKNELSINMLEVPLRASLVEHLSIIDEIERASPKAAGKAAWSLLQAVGRNIWATDKNDAKAYLQKLTSIALNKMQCYIYDDCNPKKTCTETKIRQMVNFTMQKLEEIEKEFILSPDFKVKVAVLVARFAVQNFEKAQKEYVDNHSTHAYLQKYEASMWSIFKNTVKNSTEEIIAAELFCDQLEAAVINQVRNETAMVLQTDILDNIGHSKFHLLTPILEELANCGVFHKFTEYIGDCAGYASRWLENYTNKRWFAESHPSRYGTVATEKLQGVFQNVSKGVCNATKSVNTKGTGEEKIRSWIEQFCKVVDLPLSASNFRFMSKRNISNLENLKNTIDNELKGLQSRLTEKCQNQTASDLVSCGIDLHTAVFKRLWGCRELCPFCNEPCSRTDPDHYKTDGTCHLCIKHKPAGTKGTYWTKTEKLDTLSCGFSIHQEDQYYCGVDSFKCRESGKCTTKGLEKVLHNYKDYKEFMPEWDIQPDDSDSMCKYWQWFMAKYNKELTEYYEEEPADIPESWHRISREEAVKDLRSIYG